MVIVLLLLFTITVLPVSIAFYSDDQTNPAWLTVNVIVDVLFISDIVINFKTGIFSSDNADEVRHIQVYMLNIYSIHTMHLFLTDSDTHIFLSPCVGNLGP